MKNSGFLSCLTKNNREKMEFKGKVPRRPRNDNVGRDYKHREMTNTGENEIRGRK
jgi:hypothetical protein